LVHEKTLSLLEQFGFNNAFAGLPLEKRVTLAGDTLRPAATLDYIFTRDAGLVGPALITQSALCEHHAVTCEMDLAAPKATPAPSLLAASEATPTPPPLVASKATPAPPPLAAPEATSTPPPLAAQADLSPVKPTADPTNLAPAPAALADATTPATSLQTQLWLAGFMAVGLALLVLGRKLVWRSEPAPAPAVAPDLQARTGSGIRDCPRRSNHRRATTGEAAVRAY